MGKNIFNSVLMSKVDSSKFDLSHDVKLSFSMGELIPTCVMECLPGDSVEISVENMLRFAPMIAPVMHKVRVTTHYFFVPNRILWSEWEKWITGDSDVQAPRFSITGEIDKGSVADYIGFPTGEVTADIQASPMSIAAYLKIWDEYYRDQNLQDEVFIPLVPGDNPDYQGYLSGVPLRRAWEHDYFTSALPFAQKGAAVQIPLTADADIPVLLNPTGQPGIMKKLDGTPIGTGAISQDAGPVPLTESVHVDGNPSVYDPNGTLQIDVQEHATDINTLRRAYRLQEWLERNARGGTRYIENILSHFGVRSSDSRLQRPEYIGGSKQNMVISEVLATAQSTPDDIAVGTMAGHGISVGGGNSFRYRAEEHGFIIGIVNVQPDTAYSQGLHRQFSRLDRLDYAWPTFANIGEQEVLMKELYIEGPEPTSLFGYVPRYAEYKFMNSRIAGEMRSTLNFWHLGRFFDNPPVLNEEFIESNPSTRIFAVTDPEEDHIFAHVFNRISAIRKLPKYGVPTI